MEYPRQEDMARASIHSVNLKGQRLETGKQNMRILSEKKINQTFLYEKGW